MTVSRLAALCALISVLALPATAQETSTEAVLLPHVTVARAAPAELVDQVTVSGSTTPRQEVLIFPRISGYAYVSLNAEAGDVVKAGDVLARLETRVLEGQLAQAKAEAGSALASVGQARSQIDSAKATLVNEEAKLKRAQQLSQRGNLSNADLDAAQASAEAARAAAASAQDGLGVAEASAQRAQAAMDIAQANLDDATITASVDGLILERSGSLGMIAGTGGDPLFRMARDGVIEVEAEVIETALGQINVGDPVNLQIAGVGAAQGRVRLVSPSVNPSTRLGSVQIEVLDAGVIPSGAFASGNVIIDRHEGLTVPASAVLSDGGETYVLRIGEDGVVQRVPVQAGLLTGQKREVLSGLDAGDVVMLRAGTFFGDGDRVAPVFPDAQTQEQTSAAAQGADQ
ncbi:efflux RND transporter periplasmic adaptor subunit [Primorskyibacter sp. 2E107]|uniref:efflux RND transporter periplasmic adaptor subunit n=1 Tax=Primorskyibacter sp. 2E107 TaxID=3403458 RepID=UPI003AF6418E